MLYSLDARQHTQYANYIPMVSLKMYCLVLSEFLGVDILDTHISYTTLQYSFCDVG